MPRGITQANTGYGYERDYSIPHYEYHDDHDEAVHDEVIDFDVDRDRYRQDDSSRSSTRKRNGHRGRGSRRHRQHHSRGKRGAWDRGKKGANPTVPTTGVLGCVNPCPGEFTQPRTHYLA